MSESLQETLLLLYLLGIWIIPGIFVFYPLMLGLGHIVRLAFRAHSDDAHWHVAEFAFSATLLYCAGNFFIWMALGVKYG